MEGSDVDGAGGGVVSRIRRGRVVAILRSVADPDGVVEALAGEGIGVVEVTLDSPDALGTIRRLRARGDVGVLAGTVRRADEVDAAVAAGAELCVGPALVDEVVERCRELAVPVMPGALTPSEVERAHRLGADLVKLFPASLGGPDYVRALRAPLPDVPLVVTGGVGAANARAFLAAGAAAVGVSFRGDDAAAQARALLAAVA